MEELAEFVGMDVARVVRGARNGFQIVSNALLEKGDIVLVSSLAHYSLCFTINSGEHSAAKKIEEVKEKTGKLPKQVAISHFDYMFGNEHDVYGIGKSVQGVRFGIEEPQLLGCAVMGAPLIANIREVLPECRVRRE